VVGTQKRLRAEDVLYGLVLQVTTLKIRRPPNLREVGVKDASPAFVAVRQSGVEMAKDAQRVAAGELSEAEFQERYHELVLEEFGEDDRELPELEELDDESVAERLRGALEDESSRREFVKVSSLTSSPRMVEAYPPDPAAARSCAFNHLL